jgi:hypothetical protein
MRESSGSLKASIRESCFDHGLSGGQSRIKIRIRSKRRKRKTKGAERLLLAHD